MVKDKLKLFTALKGSLAVEGEIPCPSKKAPPEQVPQGSFTRVIPKEMQGLIALLVERRDNGVYENANATQRAKYVFADFGHIIVCEEFEVPIDADVELHDGWVVTIVPPRHTGTPL